MRSRERGQYLAMNLHDRDMIKIGERKGAQEKAVENARSFYANGASLELIAKSLNMTIEQVKEIVCETTQAAN